MTSTTHLLDLALQQSVDLEGLVGPRRAQLLVVHPQLRHQFVEATLSDQNNDVTFARLASARARLRL